MNRLPPGFRFQPTDEELLFEYLRCKMFSLPLPASIIPEVSFSNYDPWDLPGMSFFFLYLFIFHSLIIVIIISGSRTRYERRYTLFLLKNIRRLDIFYSVSLIYFTLIKIIKLI